VVKYKPLLDAAIALSPHKPDACLILQRPEHPCELTPGRDTDLLEAEAAATPHACVSVAATDPLYILYTSGTTGAPKGIVRDNGGHAVALMNSMSMLYGLKPGDVMWTASDVGWVVGHSYIVYAPLLAGCTSVLYEGKPVGTPDAGAFWRVCAQHGVKVLFTAPTALRAIRKEDPEGSLVARHDLSKLEALFLAGERCDPPTAEWASALLQKPVIDHWWQTETGWSISGNFRGSACFPRASGRAASPRRATTFACWTRPGRRCRAARSARWPSGCRCRHPTCRRCGTPTTASAPPTSRPSPATTTPPTPGWWMRTAMSG
jgi:propionyl-CoA synthetase